MTLADVKNALLTVTTNLRHYDGTGLITPYLVWSEDTQSDAVYAGGQMQEQAIQGTIDLFTKTEYDPKFSQIQTALNNAGISFYLDSIQYEEDTKYIHYQWIFSIPVEV